MERGSTGWRSMRQPTSRRMESRATPRSSSVSGTGSTTGSTRTSASATRCALPSTQPARYPVDNRPETTAPRCAREGCGLTEAEAIHERTRCHSSLCKSNGCMFPQDCPRDNDWHAFVAPASATPDEPLCTRCGHDKGAHDSQGCIAGWIAGLRGCPCRGFETLAMPSPSATAAPGTLNSTPIDSALIVRLTRVVEAAQHAADEIHGQLSANSDPYWKDHGHRTYWRQVAGVLRDALSEVQS